MDAIETIAWLVVSIVGLGIMGVYLPRSPKLTQVEIELQELKKPSSEAVAKVQARDVELARISVENSSFEQEELQQFNVSSPEEIKIVKLSGGVLKLTNSNSTQNKKTTRECEKPLQKSAQVELNQPTEKLTMENMNPDTKKMLTEFLMYPTKDYIGLSNLLSTYNTDAKLRSYLSSRIGLRKAKTKTFYD